MGIDIAFEFCGVEASSLEADGTAEVDGVVGEDGISVGSVSAAVGICWDWYEEEVEGEVGGVYRGERVRERKLICGCDSMFPVHC